jgi:hypothetical protein
MTDPVNGQREPRMKQLRGVRIHGAQRLQPCDDFAPFHFTYATVVPN